MSVTVNTIQNTSGQRCSLNKYVVVIWPDNHFK